MHKMLPSIFTGHDPGGEGGGWFEALPWDRIGPLVGLIICLISGCVTVAFIYVVWSLFRD